MRPGHRRERNPRQDLAQDEAQLRELLVRLSTHGPATGRRGPARRDRCASGYRRPYLPGLAMRRIADLHPNKCKTDAEDAHIIAVAARAMPHALGRVDADDEAWPAWQ